MVDPERNAAELVQYFLVNEALGMSAGKIAAQVAHAATLTFIRAHAEQPITVERDGARFRLLPPHGEGESAFIRWFNIRMKKIVLRAPAELLESLETEGHVAIRDAGFTEVAPNSLTVVALPPMTREAAAPVVAKLRVLR